MGQYTTQNLTWGQMRVFISLFDDKVKDAGMCVKIKYVKPSRYYAVCSHLFPSEIKLCKRLEMYATRTRAFSKKAPKHFNVFMWLHI